MMTPAEMEELAKAQKAALKHLIRAIEDYHKEMLGNVREMERLATMIEERARAGDDRKRD